MGLKKRMSEMRRKEAKEYPIEHLNRYLFCDICLDIGGTLVKIGDNRYRHQNCGR